MCAAVPLCAVPLCADVNGVLSKQGGSWELQPAVELPDLLANTEVDVPGRLHTRAAFGPGVQSAECRPRWSRRHSVKKRVRFSFLHNVTAVTRNIAGMCAELTQYLEDGCRWGQIIMLSNELH